MQGKISILESDNEEVIKEKKVFRNANIHFSGLNTHRITIEGIQRNNDKDYIFVIDFTTIEAETLTLEGELHEAGEKNSSYVSLRFTPFLLKH
tara:strand:- start:1072 stop:1350 length:279 start_codon:yes stop_codon:yes gene_type:complete